MDNGCPNRSPRATTQLSSPSSIDGLELGILLLLERLAPTERAAFVLHEAFDYPYPQIAQILQTTDVNARQLVSRARKHIARSRRRPANRDGRRQLLHAFVAAARHGEIDDLEKLFADEVVGPSDRGGCTSRMAQRAGDPSADVATTPSASRVSRQDWCAERT